MKRSQAYATVADALAQSCSQSITNDATQVCDETHGKLWDGTIYYCAGEMARVRNSTIKDICGRDYAQIIKTCLQRSEESNTLINCFAAMGLGMLGKADNEHPILHDQKLRQRINSRLQVTQTYDNNWEAFNASLRIGRTMLFGDEPSLVLPHLEKMNAKYTESGYFDDSRDSGVYNNYGLMTINYSLRVVEFLENDHPVRQQVEDWFKPHAERYLALLQNLVHHNGMGWVFGRSAGVLGQLQCLVLLEQVLSKNWLRDSDAAWARRACRQLLQFMQDVFWDDELQWFSFRDQWRSCYGYRASLPMAWDLWRYFLQMEDYARKDEAGEQQELDQLPAEAMCREIITHPQRHTAYLVWSNGDIKWQMPVMGGPGWVSGDTLPRPYLPGLFEWCTGSQIPVLCPCLYIGEEEAWPAWWPQSTALKQDGERWHYQVYYAHLVNHHGKARELPISATVDYYFGDGFFERHDCFHITDKTDIDALRLEVLQGTVHPRSKQYPPVYKLGCTIESSFGNCTIGSDDVSDNPDYRNYYSHPSKRWFLDGKHIKCAPGDYTITTTVKW